MVSLQSLNFATSPRKLDRTSGLATEQNTRILNRSCAFSGVPDQESTVKKRKLSRNLAAFFAGFGLLSSLALAVWMNTWRQRESLAAFQHLAETNAAFVSHLRLPRSPELAQRLATILGTGVGFHFSGDKGGNWPAGLDSTIDRMAAKSRPASRRTSGFEIATAPLSEPGTHLVLLRHAPAFGSGFPESVLIPSLALAAVCGALAFALARGIVRPLEALTDWLPNLAPESKTQPVPPAILSRQDEIGSLALALEQTGQRVRTELELRRQSERLATLGRIATSLAHEIKNPAAAIALHADLLSQAAPPESRESVGLIREEVDRITDLVNQWLFVAKSQPARTQPHDLRDLLTNLSRRLRPTFEHCRATFRLHDGPPAVVKADAPRIEQALRNLLINAAQAMPCGGSIDARIELSPSHVELRIDDEGSGFSEEALRRFGEPFFSEREGGMGIGLTLAREVILAHGGSLRPENRAPSGARLISRLPCAITVTDPPSP